MAQTPTDPRSRYRATPTASFVAGDRTVSWLCPRILPLPDDIPMTGRSTPVRVDERLDQLAARVMGDPFAVWQLMDANVGLDPLDFLAEHSDGVDIPAPRVPR